MTKTYQDIEESLLQSRWVLSQMDDEAVSRMIQQHGLPEMIARLLHARGVGTDEVEGFLYPSLAKHFPDPLSLAGMGDMADMVADAVISGRKIGIFGDFDVDGATSTALLLRFFRHLGMDCPFYIPDRLSEGYGPNINALKTLKEQGAEIVIICDCGITAFDVIAQGRALGLDIIVLDHHEAEDTLPEATHVIDPKRQDDTSGLDMLAACGVTFLACVAINTALRAKDYYKSGEKTEPPLKSWLDIVALGTVCDMVPLTGANRLFVKRGFQLMANTDNAGLRALCEVSKIQNAPTVFHAGFQLGPRINAGSRVHKAYLGAQLLSTDDAEEAKNLAWTLNDCNDMRKEIQKEMLAHAKGIVEADRLDDHPIILVGHEDWHPGLSGLVAGRLKEQYGKPAVCITYATNEKGELEGRGSGRSVLGVNMGQAFIDARNEGLLLKGGGHAMAAGFTVAPDKIDEFRTFLSQHIEKQLTSAPDLPDFEIDAVMTVRGLTTDVVKIIDNHVGPFGQNNAEPVFVLPNVRLHMVDVVGKDHVRCMVSDWEGGSRIKAVAFGSKDTPLGEALLKYGISEPFHLAGHVKINEWNGRESAELHIKDAAFAMNTASRHEKKSA